MTSQDLKQFDDLIQKRLKEALIDALKEYPTKNDVQKMVHKATEEICETITDFTNALEEKKANISDVLVIEKRVESIERKLPQYD